MGALHQARCRWFIIAKDQKTHLPQEISLLSFSSNNIP